MTNLPDQIPSLDLLDFTGGDKRQQFVNDLGEAFNTIGFVALKNTGLTDEMRENLYGAVKRFFELPDEVKEKYHMEGLFGQRGYTGKGKEHAQGRSTGDLKEFYHVGQPLDGTSLTDGYPDNIWPQEVPEFKETTLQIYHLLEQAGTQVLRAIALYLGLEEHYFDSKVNKGNSILRPIHYFPIENPEEIPDDAVRAAEHGDINLITLLMGASADGLEILRKDGRWIPVTALPDQVVVNVGDMLSRHTNNKLKSTIHRVVNPPREKMRESRYSIPFFMHPRAEMDLSVLPSCVDDTHPKAYSDIIAGEFLSQRLEEIGLKA